MNDNNSLITSLREGIDRKYQEAIQALETISGYLSGDAQQVVAPIETPRRSSAVTVRKRSKAPKTTRVDIVLAAIKDEFKTVAQLHEELGLPEAPIRAVLYSKFVRHRLKQRVLSDGMAFRCKPDNSDQKQNDGSPSVASLVRSYIEKHPDGKTSVAIKSALRAEIEKIGGSTEAIGAALFNMKKKGVLSHDPLSGKYTVSSAAG